MAGKRVRARRRFPRTCNLPRLFKSPLCSTNSWVVFRTEQGGFYFHPTDEDLSAGVPVKEKATQRTLAADGAERQLTRPFMLECWLVRRIFDVDGEVGGGNGGILFRVEA